MITIVDNKLTNQKYSKELITIRKYRDVQDKRYAIDDIILEDIFNCKTAKNFDIGIMKTVDWYLTKCSL